VSELDLYCLNDHCRANFEENRPNILGVWSLDDIDRKLFDIISPRRFIPTFDELPIAEWSDEWCCDHDAPVAVRGDRNSGLALDIEMRDAGAAPNRAWFHVVRELVYGY
jgi:hypothetical protein